MGADIVGQVASFGTQRVSTRVLDEASWEDTDYLRTLQGFIHANTDLSAQVYTDEHGAYEGVNRAHEAVKHSTAEFVRQEAHTNGIESFWSLLKRGYYGTYHKLSPEHLQRYINEFAGRHNIREQDTVEQMEAVARGMEGKRLRFEDLKVGS